MRVLDKYQCKNILHIGGHWGEEAEEYIAMGADFTFVEPVKEFAEVIRNKGYKCLEMAVGPHSGPFYVDRGLSSFLKTNYERTPVRTEQVTAVPLSKIEKGFDTIIVDTEGTTYEVLQSGTLKYAKTLVCELRKEALFVGETTQDKVEEYLLTKGFKKVEEHPLFDDPNAFDVYFVKE